MRTVRGLFPRLCEPEHLALAAAETTRGKRRRSEVAWFLFRREDVLADIRERLLDGTWAPRGFETFHLREPKRRVIARAPVEDRVVHGALALLMEPVFLRSARPESFACRKGFGAHRAVLRILEATRRHRFALHLDVRAYFPSVDLSILRGLLARTIRDDAFLGVVDQVLASGRGLYDDPLTREWAGMPEDWPPRGRGLPIGARTSQLFATHLYLSALDHTIKRDLKVPSYIRYGDDFYLFGDRRADLRRWRAAVGRWLHEERGLRLKHPNARVLSCAGHVDALGYRVTREGLRTHPRALRRLSRRARAELYRVRGRPDFSQSAASSVAVALF